MYCQNTSSYTFLMLVKKCRFFPKTGGVGGGVYIWVFPPYLVGVSLRSYRYFIPSTLNKPCTDMSPIIRKSK